VGDISVERCLYCDEVPSSKEHTLPAGLGEFKDAPILVDRICKACNETRIGILDEQFLRCGPVALLRKRFEISGRDHHDKVNPFYRGSAGGKRIEFKAWDGQFQTEVLIEALGGNEGRQMSQLIIKGQEGTWHHFPLTAATTPQVIRDQMKALPLTAPYDLHLIYDPPTEPWAKELFEKLWPNEKLPEPTLGSKEFNGGIVRFQTTNRYFRAIAKIGFHYFLTQFPEYSGSEAIFEEIRTFITADTEEINPEYINSFISIHQHPLTPPSPGFVGHLLASEVRDGELLAHFEPFVTPGGRMQAFMIRAGIDSNRVDSLMHSHLFLYYGSGKTGNYSGDAIRVDDLALNLKGPCSGAISPMA
jgi:hypothetical protein